MKAHRSSLARDAAFGALGGIIGTVVLEQVAKALYAVESEETKRRQEHVRTLPPYEVMAEKMGNRMLGRELSEPARKRTGLALHWGYGIAAGALYGVLRRRVRAVARIAGAPFSLAFFLLGDELLNLALGTAAPPQEFPWQAHARGLATHAAFTADAEAVCSGADRWTAHRAAVA
jgi:uncharacterized membrane protein YagU involved in acid resistance